MSKPRKNTAWRDAALTLLLFLVVGGIFCALSCRIPYFADDYIRAFDFSTGQRLVGLWDILPSAEAYYRIEGGQALACALSQILLLCGRTVFNTVNVFAFLGLGILIGCHGQGHWPDPGSLLFIYGALFLLTPAFGQSYLWLTGVCNEMYGVILVLLYLLPFRMALGGRKSRLRELLKLLGMLALGFLAGAGNAGSAFALNVMVLAYLLYDKLQSLRLRPWMLAPGPVAGFLFLLLSPGEKISRASGAGLAARNALGTGAALLEHFYPLLLLLAGILVWHCCLRDEWTRTVVRQELFRFAIPLIYLLGCLSLLCFRIIWTEFPPGAWSGPLALLLIVTISFFRRAELSARGVGTVRRCTSGLLVVCALVSSLNGIAALGDDMDAFAHREAVLCQSAMAGETVQVPAISSASRYSVFYLGEDQLGYASGSRQNAAMLEYYGVGRRE